MSTETFEVATKEAFSIELDKLNEEIKKVKKQITYLDVYNISDTVTDKNTFNAKVNALMNNSSLVINTTPFFVNSQLYNTGDIILKNNYGDIVHIKAQTGGIFYPSKIAKDGSNNYVVQYAFSQELPYAEETSVPVNNQASLAKKIIFTGLNGDNNTENYVYGIWDPITFNIFKFNTVKIDGKVIQPYIKFFISSDSEKGSLAEEIVLDYKIEEEASYGRWKVTIDENNNFIANNQLWVKVK